MDCPRCESALDRYEFQGRVAYGCDRCGYIGIPVEHKGSLRPVESWNDAIERFNEKGRRSNGEVEGAVVFDEAGVVETSEKRSGTAHDAETDGADDPIPAIRRVPEPAIRRVEE